jgi:peptidoglycan/xylan/chitin deacetylase (PgdA/CDA1 family)
VAVGPFSGELKHCPEGILVLCYHSYHQGFSAYFEEHVKYLRRHCHLLSGRGFLEGFLSKASLPKRPVLITLDDGAVTDYTVAYPVLKKHRAPAISFVITDPYYTAVSGREWWKEVGEVMEIGSHTVSHAEIFISQRLTGFLTPTDGELKKMYCMVKGVRYLPGFPLFERGPELVHRQVFVPEPLVEAIQETVKGFGFFEQKEWYKVLEGVVRRNPFPFGHETEESRGERVKQELLVSKQQIERETGRKCRMLAYPWGGYDGLVIQKAKEVGYEFAFAAMDGLVSPGDDPLELKRVNVSMEDSADIEDILSRVYHR